MTIILICVIAYLLIGYGILIFIDKGLKEFIDTETIIICLFWSILLPIAILRPMIKNLKK